MRHQLTAMITGKQCFNPRTHAGCDSFNLWKEDNNCCFNPRTHAGCDIAPAYPSFGFVSFNPRTHAGCDCGSEIDVTLPCEFQSTHPRRVRLLRSNLPIQCVLFQSTHPRRVRPYNVSNPKQMRCFNPRTHAGCDMLTAKM